MFFEIGAVFEVDNVKVANGWVFDGELTQFNDSVLLFGEIIVGNGGGCGTEEGEGVYVCFSIFYNTYHDGGELGGGIFGGLVLVVGGFVGFVDDDES